MKKGFTMIELIFVIVILGILAAVAIPKLAATRDDAKISTLAANAATVLADAGAYYTSQGSANWTGGAAVPNWEDVTNVTLYTAAGTSALGQAISVDAGLYTDGSAGAQQVILFSTAADGNFTVSQGTGTNTISVGVQDMLENMTDGANDYTHEFGGTGVVR